MLSAYTYYTLDANKKVVKNMAEFINPAKFSQPNNWVFSTFRFRQILLTNFHKSQTNKTSELYKK